MINVYLLLDGCVWTYLLSGTTHVFIFRHHTTDVVGWGILVEKYNRRFVDCLAAILAIELAVMV